MQVYAGLYGKCLVMSLKVNFVQEVWLARCKLADNDEQRMSYKIRMNVEEMDRERYTESKEWKGH